MPKRENRCCFLYFGRFGCISAALWRIEWAEPGKAPYDTYTESCTRHVGLLLPSEPSSVTLL